MKKLNFFLLLGGLLFFVVLIEKTGTTELCNELKLLGWGLLPFVLGEGVAEMIHTVGWRYCLEQPYRSISWWRLYQIRMAGYALNYLTPTAALAGEAAKINLLALSYRGPKAASGVLIEKLCFPFAQVLFVLIGSVLLVGRVHLPKSLWVSMLLSVSAVTGGILLFYFLQKKGKLCSIIRWLAARRPGSPALHKVSQQTNRVDDALRDFYTHQSRNMWIAISWHLLGYCIGFFQTWIFLHSVGEGTALPIVAAIWFLGMWFDLLTFAIPLNMGSLEGSRMIVFKAIGYPALPGMAYGLAIRISQIFWSIVGLTIYGYLTAKSRKDITESPGALRYFKVLPALLGKSLALFYGCSNKRQIRNYKP